MAKKKVQENSLKNLQPFDKLDKQELKKRASNGGKKSVETRRKLK